MPVPIQGVLPVIVVAVHAEHAVFHAVIHVMVHAISAIQKIHAAIPAIAAMAAKYWKA